MKDQLNETIKNTTTTANKAVEAARDVTEKVTDQVTDFSVDGLLANFKSMISSFDESPLAFVKENPMRATIGGFFLGLIFGAAMSKRSVTK